MSARKRSRMVEFAAARKSVANKSVPTRQVSKSRDWRMSSPKLAWNSSAETEVASPSSKGADSDRRRWSPFKASALSAMNKLRFHSPRLCKFDLVKSRVSTREEADPQVATQAAASQHSRPPALRENRRRSGGCVPRSRVAGDGRVPRKRVRREQATHKPAGRHLPPRSPWTRSPGARACPDRASAHESPEEQNATKTGDVPAESADAAHRIRPGQPTPSAWKLGTAVANNRAGNGQAREPARTVALRPHRFHPGRRTHGHCERPGRHAHGDPFLRGYKTRSVQRL
jgi:hypothetical protein